MASLHAINPVIPMPHRLAQFLVAATFLLLFVGGLVTSTDSGLAVPDWPLSYGKLFPPMVGGIRFEHTHRLVAASVGLLTLILTIWIGKRETRPWVRWLAIASLGAVVLQGILGGLTVIFLLPVPVSVAHACLGPIFFCLVAVLAEVTSPGSVIARRPAVFGGTTKQSKDTKIASPAFGGLLMTSKAVLFAAFLQILLGAVVRHTGQGIWFHVLGAFLVFLLTGFLVTQALSRFGDDRRIFRPALLLGLLVTVEFFLGVSAFLFTRIAGVGPEAARIILPTLHQTLGAAVLAASVVLALRVRALSPLSRQGGRPLLCSFLEITKPRLVTLVLWSVTVGFFLASRGPIDFSLLSRTLIGTALAAAGSMVLNQYLERETDARMKRTENRPLPSGRMVPGDALSFGIFLSLIGIVALARGVNLLSSFLSALTLVIYLFLYTPLKKKTPLCTLIGAIPGAIPPMLGWAAARGEVGCQAWILFAILFVWQLPHFFAIAWIYREDYARAGLEMLSVVDPTGKQIGAQMMIYSLGLHLLSLVPAVVGMMGPLYYLGALLLGIWFLASSFRTAFQLNLRSRSFFKRSVIYLTLLFLLMIVEKRPV